MARWKNSLQTNEEIQRIKREAVLRESGRIFSRKGYHNVSLDDIAKTLNVSKGTLYNYVKDKQEILFECHKMSIAIGDKAFEQAEAAGVNAATKLKIVIYEYIATITDELGACAVLTEINALRPSDRKIIIGHRDRLDNMFCRIIEEGVADKSIRPLDPKLTVFTFMGAVNSVPIWYSPRGRLSSTEIATMMVDILLNGIAASESIVGDIATATSPPAPAPRARKKSQ
jgi:AcrR family transcriptional regulator